MIQITEHTSDDRGDHAADVTRAHKYIPGETVEALALRCLGPLPPDARNSATFDIDRIEIRYMVEAKGGE